MFFRASGTAAGWERGRPAPRPAGAVPGDLKVEYAVQLLAVAQLAVGEAYRVDRGAYDWPLVGQAEYVLHEHILDALLAQRQPRHERVAAAQRQFEGHVEPCHHGVDAPVVQVGETHAVRPQKFMARVFDVVLIVGIVHDALKVAFVVAHLHRQFEDIVHVDDMN